jgi:hypothetical protein
MVHALITTAITATNIADEPNKLLIYYMVAQKGPNPDRMIASLCGSLMGGAMHDPINLMWIMMLLPGYSWRLVYRPKSARSG